MVEKEYFFNFAIQFRIEYAQVAELVDALDSKSSDFGRVGSIPTLSTDLVTFCKLETYKGFSFG